MKKIIFILSFIILNIFIIFNLVYSQEGTYLRYYRTFENGNFLDSLNGNEISNILDYYIVTYSPEGLMLHAEKYSNGNIVERLYFYDNGKVKIREMFSSPLYSVDINNNLTYTTDQSPNVIFYYTRDGEFIGTHKMKEYLYSKSFYNEGIRKYYDDFNLDFIFVRPKFVLGETIIKGIAKRTNSIEVIFSEDRKIQRIEKYRIFNKLRRIPINVYDFQYNEKGQLFKIKSFVFNHGKLYLSTEYWYIYDSYGRVTSRHKMLFYTNLLYIDEVLRYKYEGNKIKKISKYENLTIPFVKQELKDEDFRLVFDGFYEYNNKNLLSRILYKTFLYSNPEKKVASEYIERTVEFTYTDDNKLSIITELLRNALNRVMHYYYDEYGNIIRKERIIYFDISKNENVSYYYYDGGKGPLRMVIRDSFVKKEKLIEYYLSEKSIEKMEIFYNEELAGVFYFNYSGDITTEIKYIDNGQIRRVDYQYYNNGCVYSATMYDKELIAKVIYFSEEIPFLYGDIIRVDYYIDGVIFVSHFYYRGEKLKSIFYKDGKIFYIKEYYYGD